MKKVIVICFSLYLLLGSILSALAYAMGPGISIPEDAPLEARLTTMAFIVGYMFARLLLPFLFITGCLMVVRALLLFERAHK